MWLEEVDVSDANAAFGYAPRQQQNDPTKVVQWYCEKIVVRDRRKGAAAWEYFYFPMQRWLYPGKHYLVQHLNVALPQFDVLNQIPSSASGPDGAGSERELEISENKRMYLYEQKAPGLPVQVSQLLTLFQVFISPNVIIRFNSDPLGSSSIRLMMTLHNTVFMC